MNCWKTLLAGCLIFGLAACGADPEETTDPQPGGGFVEEGGNVTPGDADDRDYCAEFGWYSDGRCDDFCLHPDPDCGGLGTDPYPSEPAPAPAPGPTEPTEPDPGPEPGPDPSEPTPVDPLPLQCLDDSHPSVMRVGDVEECMLIDFGCPENWDYFADDCGCGCVEMQFCDTDADCPDGYCELPVVCEAEECPPPPPGQCVHPNCDEPSDVMCDALPQTCGPGLIAAARNGCWECVDARTCEPVYFP